MSPQKPSQPISWQDFEKVDIRLGTVVKAEEFPEARNPAYKLFVDFGEQIGILKSSAQITEHYTVKSLIGKRVLGVVNFPPKQIGPVRSECLIVGFHNEQGHVTLATLDDAFEKLSSDKSPGDVSPGDFSPGDFSPGDFSPGKATPDESASPDNGTDHFLCIPKNGAKLA